MRKNGEKKIKINKLFLYIILNTFSKIKLIYVKN